MTDFNELHPEKKNKDVVANQEYISVEGSLRA